MASIFQKKKCQEGHQYDEPHILGYLRNPQSHHLRHPLQVILVMLQKFLHAVDGDIAPTMFLSDLPGDFPGTYLVQQAWHHLPKARRLPSQIWPDKEEQSAEKQNENEVNNGNSTSAPVHQLLNM